MMTHPIILIAGLLVALSLVACDDRSDDAVEVSAPARPLVEVKPQPVVVFDRALGQQVYQANCAG